MRFTWQKAPTGGTCEVCSTESNRWRGHENSSSLEPQPPLHPRTTREAVWGEEAQRVHLATPSEHESNGAPGGIANRTRSTAFWHVQGWSVYNSTSLVGHQSKNNDWFEARNAGEGGPANLDKMICFADSRVRHSLANAPE